MNCSVEASGTKLGVSQTFFLVGSLALLCGVSL